MPAIKNALLRYRIIDRSIRNEYNPYPTKEQLRQACEEEIYGTSEGLHICHSTIEKDIFAMRMEHDAPISYSKREKDTTIRMMNLRWMMFHLLRKTFRLSRQHLPFYINLKHKSI